MSSLGFARSSATVQAMSSQPVPFSQWMERALFDPQRGYYSRRIVGIGRRGDFSTSASLDAVLGEAVAAWIKEERTRDATVRTVIEVGGGDGSLMSSVLKSLGWWTRTRTKFCMVERSPVLHEQQQTRLKGRSVRWFDDLGEALRSCDGAALIYHNELLDAFPVTLVQWSNEEMTWCEVCVEVAANAVRESLQPLCMAEADAAAFSALHQWTEKQPPPHGSQRCELGKASLDWLRSWSPHWKRGAMLTLDYGDVFPLLYRRKPAGTLRAYLMHQVLTGSDVYQNMGRQDITADVNFTDLMNWGAMLGWENGALETQREFLQRHVYGITKRAAASPAIAFLVDRNGAGGAFKALVQRPVMRA